MRHIAGTIGGLCSGFLIYMMAAMVFLDFSTGSSPSPVFVLTFLIGAWVLTHLAIIRKTKGFAKPMARAFLIGSCEWMVMVVVGIIFSGKLMGEAGNSAGAAIGGGLIAMMTGGVSVGFSILCAFGFFLFHFIGREGAQAMAADQLTKKCTECAELVLKEARKCKHCGFAFEITPEKSAV